MEEARKIIIEIPFNLIIITISALCTVIATMAVYFVALKKSDKRESKENLTIMSNALLKAAEGTMAQSSSNLALSQSIDRSKESQDRISQETSRILMSITEKLIELKNGKH